MADNKTLGLPYLLDHMQLKRPWEKNPVPETLQELKTAKNHLLTQVFDPLEKAFLLKALRSTKGNITQAAGRVGMQRSNFCLLLRRHHLSSDHLKHELEENNLEE